MGAPASANVAVTYANDRHTDGAGAQLQRIYGVYALSRFLNLLYVHSPLSVIDYHGLIALESNSFYPDLESRYNSVFRIPSDIELPTKVVVHDMAHANREVLERLNAGAKSEQTFILVRIVYPYPIVEHFPDIYRCVGNVSPFKRTKLGVFRLAIHVRRGELLVVNSSRMLPNSYYLSCALRFVEALKKLNIPFTCELYTEAASKPFMVTPQHRGIPMSQPRDLLLNPELDHLEDFDAIPYLVKFVNLDPIETLKRMATADALILSRSSFSYVSAILNPEGIVVYHPFWHNPMSKWLIADSTGNFASSELLARLRGFATNSSSVR